MAHQKPKNFISYKFRALKTFASNEWLAEGKKKYRQVFDQDELSYIHVEFSFYNKLFDEEDWEANIHLRAYRINEDGGSPEEICKLELQKHISQYQDIIYIREQQGQDQTGVFWVEGTYYWEAFIDGTKVGKTNFYVYQAGQVSADLNPYFELDNIRLYEGANADRGMENPTYLTDFHNKDTRFVWIEFEATNLLDRAWKCELIFNIFNDARQLKGQMTELVDVAAGAESIRVFSGWGSDLRGTWFPDNYTVELVFMDTLIGVTPFKVGEEMLEGESPLIRPIDPSNLPHIAASPSEVDEMSLEEVLAELDELIGLDSVKARIREYSQYLNFLTIRKDKGFEDTQPLNLHAVFTGNPGTGKTTIARQLGRIYKKLGLLSKGHVHEVDRSDIIGEYIGQTAPKVRTALDKSKGGILFIDEAYALYRSKEDTKDYGREVIEMLVREMSTSKGDFAVVVAGYPREMELFLDSNPGLKSRFNMRYEFPDYQPPELLDIATYWTEKMSVNLSEEAETYLEKQLIEAYRNRDKSFGNARYVLSLINEAKMNMGLRLMKGSEPEELSKEELSRIEQTDLEAIFEIRTKKLAQIPVDEAELARSLDELNTLIGLQQVKNEIHELVKLVKFYREIGKDVLHRFSLHSIFTGNPGTGKTTVARIIGRIYKALGILERGHLTECDRQALVAGHVGQTAQKTAEVIEQARGGVLFIDEAYSLTQGGPNDFGREAIETLLKRMEDMRGELVVIAVGYPENMRQFLETNPGLKSRFDRKLVFSDYEPEELLRIANMMFASEDVAPDQEAEAHLKTYFEHLYQSKNRYFGNARAVRKVVEKAVKNQHLRLASLPAHLRNPKMLHELVLSDVAEFSEGNDSLLEGGRQGRVGF